MNEYDPVAEQVNIVLFGNARFTLLTEKMIRLEWAEDRRFEDRASLVVVNRKFPPVDFSVSESKGRLTIRTGAFSIEYVERGRPFTNSNPVIKFDFRGKKVKWHYGKRDGKNLGGTIRTLDSTLGDRVWTRPHCDPSTWAGEGLKPIELGQGLLSRSGWCVIDDTASIVLDKNGDGRPWVDNRPQGRRMDLYFMCYGLDFKTALADGSRLLGRQPLPPSYAFGYWFSRYRAFTDKELEELVETFVRFDLPLSVLVIDMDWHLEGWTGYTWDERYFPDYREFLSWCRAKNVRVTLNLHPADGVARHEKQFVAMARRLGLEPEKTERIEFDCTDPAFMEAYFQLLHRPYERDGVDFWWIDWQQGDSSALTGLDPLPWLNHLHWHDQAERGLRPLIFSRYGGLGSGRHAVGFSGDTVTDWRTLAYQPFFTATAANVLYGYWSHDIGGHLPGPIEPELYLRWVQFGIFSPVLRTHMSKCPGGERKMWLYPQPYSGLMMNCLRLRDEMFPYIYSECLRNSENGLSLCRPLYHEHPELKSAYKCNGEYYFGSQLIVSPVTGPVCAADGMAVKKLWLPPGDWFDLSYGDLLGGGRKISRKYMLSEIPVYARAGTILPGRRGEGLVITAFPGASDSEYTLLEDDGSSPDYSTRNAVRIRLRQTRRSRTIKITVEKFRGDYAGFPSLRPLEIRLPATAVPISVEFNSNALPWVYRLDDFGWSWDSGLAGIVIRLPEADLAKTNIITVRVDRRVPEAAGLCGLFRRLDTIRRLCADASGFRVLGPFEREGARLAQTGNRISRRPEIYALEINELRHALPLFDGVLSRWISVSDSPALKYLEKARAVLKSVLKEKGFVARTSVKGKL